jgi:hypothetical protein
MDPAGSDVPRSCAELVTVIDPSGWVAVTCQVSPSDPVPVSGAQPSLVLPGDHKVAHTRGGAVPQLHLSLGNLSRIHAAGSGACVELGHGGVVRGDQQTAAPGSPVRSPRVVRGLDHGVVIAAGDASVLGVGVHAGGVTRAEPPGGLGLPTVAEPPQPVQRGGVPVPGEQAERVAGRSGAELVVVADQQQLCAGLPGLCCDRGEVEGAAHGRLVND